MYRGQTVIVCPLCSAQWDFSSGHQCPVKESAVYLKNHLGTTQREALPGQTRNNAGGYSWTLDDFGKLRRFLILGSEGGTYYASERKTTKDNLSTLDKILAKGFTDGARRAVDLIAEVSEAGVAPKNDPALLALAYCAKKGDDNTRAYTLAQLPRVARIGTHLYHFAAFVNELGGWGRGTRRAIARWFNEKPIDQLAYQLVKYQSRDGWSARDLLRLSHAKPPSQAHDATYQWAVGKHTEGMLPEMIEAFERAKRANSVVEITDLITRARLPREAIPTQWLTEIPVWAALLPHMKPEALIRNLATMTRVGVFNDAVSLGTALDGLSAPEVTRSKVHPIKVLSGLKTYAQGHGERGGNTWVPVQRLVDALDAAFYASFGNVEPAGKRTLLGLDISGSMFGGVIAGVPGLHPAMAAGAMAMITAASEPGCDIMGFTSQYEPLALSPRRRLDDNLRVMQEASHRMGSTDCAKPVLTALKNRQVIDTFVVYTDNETWAGGVHPSEALRRYRAELNPRAKLIVVGMTATNFTIANPGDPGSLDVVGFDASAPVLMNDFARE